MRFKKKLNSKNIGRIRQIIVIKKIYWFFLKFKFFSFLLLLSEVLGIGLQRVAISVVHGFETCDKNQNFVHLFFLFSFFKFQINKFQRHSIRKHAKKIHIVISNLNNRNRNTEIKVSPINNHICVILSREFYLVFR